MSETTPTQYEELPGLGDYLRVLRRQAPLIVGVAIGVLLLALVYATLSPTSFESTATVLIRPLTSNPLDTLDAPDRAPDLDTEQQILTSAVVIGRALSDLPDAADVREAQRRISVDAPADGQVLQITYTATSASGAAQGAAAVADAYIGYRGERANEALDQAIEDLQSQLDTVAESLAETTTELAAAEEGSFAFLAAENRRALLQDQVSMLTGELTNATARRVDPGEVIGPPAEPNSPSSPGRARTGLIALVAGLITGVAVALLRDRLDDDLNDAGLAGRILRTQVLSVVPGGEASAGERVATINAYRRLALTLDRRRPDAIIVASVEPMIERTSTAVNLAVTLAGEYSVLLVDVAPSHPAVDELLTEFGDKHEPAFVDASRKIIKLRHPSRLHVIPLDEDAQSKDRYGLNRESMTKLLDQVAAKYDFVIVDALPLSQSVDALELRSLSSGMVLAVREGQTKRSELAETQVMLEQVGLPVLGVVVHGSGRFDLVGRLSGMTRPAPAQRVDAEDEASWSVDAS
ncbi:Wzz/FepE/Etk N-terminal domain-containing protein [Euzebya tangerina]|uniref:Wzz/FepE/Etk N-terminal domain-containing protein n=1 Tax=Euzebya tangerina TaxID=591198 RepID=UPI000E31D078|nr:Wzz/FepE/Etk N-terminal domain-containing protein [Euzebya tangerina]